MNGLPLLSLGLLIPTQPPTLMPEPTPDPVAPTAVAVNEKDQGTPHPSVKAGKSRLTTVYSYPGDSRESDRSIASPEVFHPETSDRLAKNPLNPRILPHWQAPVPSPAPQRSREARSLPIAPSPVQPMRPLSGGQLYYQRLAALQQGQLYTRLPSDSFADRWQHITYQPTHQEWVTLLAREANAVAKGQGRNRLSIVLGDSLSQWMPTAGLPSGQLWLNQSISGETTSHVLKRIPLLAATRPNTIYVMAGINDLRRGYSDAVIITNLYTIARQLRQQHPNARIVMQSILPTRYDALPVDRIQRLNQSIAAIANHTNTEYMNLADRFSDDRGILRRDLTTDGLHLSDRGYTVWQAALTQDLLAYAN